MVADDANAALDTTEPKETQQTETTAVTTTTDDADDQGGLDDDDAGEEIVLKSFKLTMVSGDKTTKEVECPQVPADTLKTICEYLEHHGRKAPFSSKQSISSNSFGSYAESLNNNINNVDNINCIILEKLNKFEATITNLKIKQNEVQKDLKSQQNELNNIKQELNNAKNDLKQLRQEWIYSN